MSADERTEQPPPAPGNDEEEAIVTDDGDARMRLGSNEYEEFVKGLPEGICVCPMCLAVGAVVEDPPFDPRTHMCMTCLGHGWVRTGSIVTGNVTQKCGECEGKGWVWNEPGAPLASPANALDLADDAHAVDHMGRTPDDPDFAWDRVVRAGGEPQAEPEPVPA